MGSVGRGGGGVANNTWRCSHIFDVMLRAPAEERGRPSNTLDTACIVSSLSDPESSESNKPAVVKLGCGGAATRAADDGGGDVRMGDTRPTLWWCSLLAQGGANEGGARADLGGGGDDGAGDAPGDDAGCGGGGGGGDNGPCTAEITATARSIDDRDARESVEPRRGRVAADGAKGRRSRSDEPVPSLRWPRRSAGLDADAGGAGGAGPPPVARRRLSRCSALDPNRDGDRNCALARSAPTERTTGGAGTAAAAAGAGAE